MPAIYTHYKFSNEVYDNLSDKLKDIIDNNHQYYTIFSLSFDSLFFYNLFFPFKGKKIRELGAFAHRNNTNDYFLNLINYIKNNEDNNQLKTYLFGSITHYVLDKTMHPFIFYKTGVYKPKIKSTHKYNNKHAHFEFMLDAYFYELDHNLKYKNYKIHRNIIPKLKFDENIKNCINDVFFKTFGVNNLGSTFNKAYHHQHYIYKYIIEDKFGLKHNFLKIVDKLLTNKVKNIQNNSTYIKNVDTSLFNLDNKNWNPPTNKSIIYNDSIIDLYNKALKECVKLVNLANKVLNNEIETDVFLRELGNKTYTTNLNVFENKKMKYFEY